MKGKLGVGGCDCSWKLSGLSLATERGGTEPSKCRRVWVRLTSQHALWWGTREGLLQGELRGLSLNSPGKLNAIVVRKQGPRAKGFVKVVWLNIGIGRSIS